MTKEQTNPDSKSKVIKNVKHQDHFDGGDDTIDLAYRHIERVPLTYDQKILTAINEVTTATTSFYPVRSVYQFLHAGDSIYRYMRDYMLVWDNLNSKEGGEGFYLLIY